MKLELAKQFRKTRQHYQDLRGILATLNEDVKSMSDLEELADIAFACRELAGLFDQMRKDSNKTGELAQKIACVQHIQLGLTDPIRTEFCSASPQIKQQCVLPRADRHPEQYAKLMEFLGVPKESCAVPENGHSLVSFNWKGITDLATQRAEKGLPVPPGCDPELTFAEYKLQMRKKGGKAPDSNLPA